MQFKIRPLVFNKKIVAGKTYYLVKTLYPGKSTEFIAGITAWIKTWPKTKSPPEPTFTFRPGGGTSAHPETDMERYMKAAHYKTIQSTIFDNDIAKGVTGRIAIGKADGAPNFCMRLFEVAKGGYTPRHSHAWEHEIFVHSGEGEVYSNGDWHPISRGHTVFIPGDEEHQIKNRGDGDLVFVCLIPKGAPEL
jgi:quercetin dioxygenase-like cupin family protein